MYSSSYCKAAAMRSGQRREMISADALNRVADAHPVPKSRAMGAWSMDHGHGICQMPSDKSDRAMEEISLVFFAST